MKPIKFSSIKDVYNIGEKRLQRMLSRKKFTVKIKDGVAPDEMARIFSSLG